MKIEYKQRIAKMNETFKANENIVINDSLPLARWAYFGAEASIDNLISDMENKDSEAIKYIVSEKRRRLTNLKEVLIKRFPDDEYLQEDLGK